MKIENSDDLVAADVTAETHRHPFSRTTCACKDCVQCCYDQPGALMPGDLGRIAAFLKQPVEAILRFFWASPGALAMNRFTGRLFRIGTITPRREGGKCVFLDDQNRCRIHPVAPGGCAFFDTHMNGKEAQQRSSWLAMEQQNEEYQQLRTTLPTAKSYRPRGF